VGSDDEIVLARVNADVVNGDGWQVVLQLRPAAPAVARVVGTNLVSNKEKRAGTRMLANYLH